MRNRRSERGLTLIEVMVSAVIVSVMAGAVYMALAQGLRVWRRAVEEKPELKMDLFFDRIQSDLRNAFSYNAGSFAGTENAMQFLTLCQSPWRENRPSAVLQIPAKVRYYYDPDTASIYREQIRYEKVLYPKSNTGQEPSRRVMDKIQGFNIEYYERDKENKFDWKRKWSQDCFPQAVKILIDYGQSKPQSISRIVNIPAAEGCLS